MLMEERIREAGIVPVVKLEEIEKATSLAAALRDGGINCAEVTFRAAKAEYVMDRIRSRFTDMLVGAGTVLSLQEAKRAVDGGAEFLVSPGFDERIVDFALANDVLPLPGCVTPTEIQYAIAKGLRAVKFFPAAQYGGLKTIKALAGPFAQVRFMPTGGISLENLAEYLQEKSVLACGGTFMVKDAFLLESDWEKVTDFSRQATEIVRKTRKQEDNEK